MQRAWCPKSSKNGAKLMPKMLWSRAWGHLGANPFKLWDWKPKNRDWNLENGRRNPRKWALECGKWRLGFVIRWPTPQYPVKRREEIDRRAERRRHNWEPRRRRCSNILIDKRAGPPAVSQSAFRDSSYQKSMKAYNTMFLINPYKYVYFLGWITTNWKLTLPNL